MSLCHECGSEVAETDAFCPFCGISQQRAVEPTAQSAPAEPADESMDSTIMMPAVKAENMKQPDIKRSLPVADQPAAFDPSSAFTSDTSSARLTSEDFDIPAPAILSDFDPAIGPRIAEMASEVSRPVSDVAPQVPEHMVAIVHEDLPVAEIMPEKADQLTTNEVVPIVPAPEFVAESAARPDDAEERLAMIEKPVEGLPDEDPLTPSMFDSVRIMEGQIPEDADNVETRLGAVYADPKPREPEPDHAAPAEESAANVTGNASSIGLVDTDGRKSAKLKPLSEGTILNKRYEIVRKIGGGGMGAVYLASDNNLGGVLRAVKEMVQAHIEEEQQDKAINDFKRESMILSTLDHPAIPTIYDYFYDAEEGRFYLVMKYISGGDLSARLRSAPEGKVDERSVTEWAIQIIDVLDYLHNQPTTIVYRDLKPSNVMLDGNSGRVMLIDFGIARSIGQKEEKGVTAVGTMGYAPPELFSGNVEPRSDIYSLGSTMFHLLTGADPQSNPLLIFDFQKNPRPRQINPQLSDQMERILMKTVEYNADSRFASAAELKTVLEDHLSGIKSGNLSYGVSEIPVSVSLANQAVFCGFCGQRIVATDLFCAFCGAKQPIAQHGVHSEIYQKSGITARLVLEGTSELSAPIYALQKDENLVGRRDPMSNIFPEVDLSKYDPQTKISRRHAKIWRDGSEFLVEDLGSSNGTLLEAAGANAFRLPSHKPHKLSSGDKIMLGDTTLHFIAG